MTLRVLNDDPRCEKPLDCGVHRLALKICQGCKQRARARRIALKARAMRQPWSCPSGCEEMYLDLKTKVGATEARRLVEAHARRAAARSVAA